MAGEQFFYNRPLFPAQLDMSHPLTKGLVGCWVLNGSDQIRVWDSSPYKNHGYLVNTAKGRWQGVYFDNANSQVGFPLAVGGLTHPLLAGASAFSCAFLIKANPVPDIAGIWTKGLDDASGWTGCYFGTTGGGSGDDLVFAIKGTGQMTIGYTDAIVLNANDFFTVTYDGKMAAAGVVTYKNGVVLTPTVAGDTLTVANTNTADIILGNGLQYSWFYGGFISLFVVWNRVLTKVECSQLHLNPYNMFLR